MRPIALLQSTMPSVPGTRARQKVNDFVTRPKRGRPKRPNADAISVGLLAVDPSPNSRLLKQRATSATTKSDYENFVGGDPTAAALHVGGGRGAGRGDGRSARQIWG